VSAGRHARSRTGRKGAPGTGGRAAERDAAERRRNRIPIVLAGVAAVAIVATSFPFSVLLNQHRQLSAEAAQLSQLQRQNALLAEQRQQLNSNAEVKRLAQQNYQLVQPGRSLFVILPPTGQASSSAPGSPTAGDPADRSVVSPADAPNMTPDPGLPQVSAPVAGGASSATGTGSGGATRPAPSSFWSRVASSFEFWK
jgi:cell division protein FtsB